MRTDPHSYTDLDQGQIQEIDLSIAVDFEARCLRATARLTLAEARQGPLDLDSRGLIIDSIQDNDGSPVPFEIFSPEPVLGQRVRVTRDRPIKTIVLTYKTGPDASALMWLDPAQTDGGELPFMLTQCQAIHARAVVPLQDTPAARIEYTASVTVPEALSAVMSAAPAERSAGPEPGTATLRFSMPQPIPPYLMALAVGHLESRDLGPRTRVHAEPGTVEQAAWEFADVEKMLAVAEELFGPYEWERFDFIVLPPSFPLGGMENPRMTFLTPTLLAGDRSLVGVLAHELAHSWTGNLVTNANNEHFWLNEGWTVYAERRITEALNGPETAAQEAILGRVNLEKVLKERKKKGRSNALHYDQVGLDPDEEFSILPYERGFLLVVALERAVGRPRFDKFVRAYIEHFRFTSITSSDFVAFVEKELPEAGLDLKAMLRAEDLPEDAPTFHSPRLEKLKELADGWSQGARLDPEDKLSTTEALFYLFQLPELNAADCVEIRDRLSLGREANAELRSAWLAKGARAGVPGIKEELRDFIGAIGRTKLVHPVVAAMVDNADLKDYAKTLVDQNAYRLHATTRGALAELFEQ